MKKRFLNIFIALGAMLALASCVQDDIELPDAAGVPDGYMSISFKANSPEMKTVEVRAVDPDGVDVQNITLFCFNPYGLFISTVNANSEQTSGTTGKFSAEVPEETKIIHFIANQNPSLYNDEDFMNKTEAVVMADMEGASGMLIYWARFEASDNGMVFQKELAEKGTIELIRNQAKISIKNWNTEFLEVTGFVTTGIHAFGTVAPHSAKEGFVWPGTEEFVTLPQNETLMSDIEDVNTKNEDYIFEHENTIDNPVSVIIRGIPRGGTQPLYYRVALVDGDGEQLLIRRNHSYVLNISGALTHGSRTFAEALEAPFTNNVWISIDSWVPEVQDATYKLAVEKTGIVLSAEEAGVDYNVNYTISRVAGGSLDASDIAQVSWLGANDVAEHDFVSHTFDPATGKGRVTIKLHPMSKDLQKGTLLIKKGRLQRIVEINIIKKQVFTPSWVGTQVYGGTTGENVTLKFTIPENCPDILYPFPVLITVNSLDVRSASGMQLPVIRKGDDEWFGSDFKDHEYKYEYIVDGPGVHRLYFENILTHPDNYVDSLWVEANHFETLKKNFVYAGHQRAITVSGLREYWPGTSGEGYAADEVILYKLVPKKRYAHVDFEMVMKDNANGNAINVGAKDEFLLYSKTLDHYTAENIPSGMNLECNYYEVPDNVWETSKSGRMFMFMPKNTNGSPTGYYTMHLRTNRAESDDVVRISSNQPGNNSVLNGSEDYSGNTYRSVIFELATYRPFRFAATVNGVGEIVKGAGEENVDEISLTYQPNQEVDIEFDVTSFQDSDLESVDPFGEEFEIYIDAPMLQIDESRLAACNLNSDKLRRLPDGRFVYTVAKTRDEERAFGVDKAILTDGSNADQTGERKRLPFKTSKITSAGKITVSSNAEKVVYYEKVFKITNETIKGTIHYDAGGVKTPMPTDAFVAFARSKDGVRIGSIMVTSDGQYSLNLRSEYQFGWTTEEVEFDYIAKDGKVYHYHISSLSELYGNPDVVLEQSN
jgi:hypothetical protein